MIAGFALQERARGPRDRRLRDRRGTCDQIARIARQTAAIGLGGELADEEIVLLDESHAGTYGIPDAKTLDAIRLCARLEGMLTDPVYEGKSMAALIDLVRSGRIGPARASSTPTWAAARPERLRRRVLAELMPPSGASNISSKKVPGS